MNYNKLHLTTTEPKSVIVTISGSLYKFLFTWIEDEYGGWFLNIYDAEETLIVGNIALITGDDNLLYQFKYLIGFGLTIQTNSGMPPGRYELDSCDILLFEYDS